MPSQASLTKVKAAIDRGVGANESAVVAVDQHRVVLVVQGGPGLGDVRVGVAVTGVVAARLYPTTATDGTA